MSENFVVIHDDGSIEEFTTCTKKAVVYEVCNPKKRWMENRIGYIGPCRIGNTPIFIKDDNGQTHIVYGRECFWKPFNEDRMELTEEEKEYWTQKKIENIEAGKKLRKFAEAVQKCETIEEIREVIKILED